MPPRIMIYHSQRGKQLMTYRQTDTEINEDGMIALRKAHGKRLRPNSYGSSVLTPLSDYQINAVSRLTGQRHESSNGVPLCRRHEVSAA